MEPRQHQSCECTPDQGQRVRHAKRSTDLADTVPGIRTYSAERNKPYTKNRGILNSFHDALEAIEISEAERKVRNLVFHSLRHYANTYLSVERFSVVEGRFVSLLVRVFIGRPLCPVWSH